MRTVLKSLVLVALLSAAGGALASEPTFVRLDTDAGGILLVMYPELAPNHVANFTHLARTGFYDGTKFHRIIKGFMIQGGDPNSKDADPRNDGMGGPTMSDVLTADEQAQVAEVNGMLEKKGYQGLDGPANLKAEFSKTAHHLRGTLSMARAQDPNSAGSQFFICDAPAPQLDGQYTVFGQVVTGLDVVDTIVSGEKNPGAGRDAPAVPVAIRKATVIEGTADLTAEETAAWDAMDPTLKNVK